VVQPHVFLHSRPHEIYRETSYTHDRDETDFRSCVLEFANCADTLSIAASLKNANQILLDDSVIKELKRSIRHLTILKYSDSRSFSVVRTVAQHLVGDGTVHELCAGQCKLSGNMLTELLGFAAVGCGSSGDLSGCAEAGYHINDCWTQAGYDSLADTDVTGSPGSLSDLYDVALQPCGTTDLMFSSSSSPVMCRRCSAPSSSSEGGVRALSLINLELTSGSIDTVLSDVLPRLRQLEKLALIELTETNKKRTPDFCKASEYLCTQIQCGQLSHVILDGCFIPSNFLSVLLAALLRRCRYVIFF